MLIIIQPLNRSQNQLKFLKNSSSNPETKPDRNKALLDSDPSEPPEATLPSQNGMRICENTKILISIFWKKLFPSWKGNFQWLKYSIYA